MNGITNSGAKGINALGQRYMGKYHPLMEIGPRYLLIQGTHRELTEGNGPPFALDVAPMLVLFAIVMTFCILGCFLPSMPLLLICVPIFVPIAKVFGWNLIWFGVIITVLDNMASITPPFGISLFVMKEVAGVTLGAMSPAGMHHSAETPARRHPKVGSDVTIYAGATLLGGATEVGDNVVIGGNAFLTESVESDTKVSIKKPEMTFRVKGGRF